MLDKTYSSNAILETIKEADHASIKPREQFPANFAYQNVRHSFDCPFCGHAKSYGALACWPCYHSNDLRHPNPEAEKILERVDNRLSKRKGGR